MCTNYEASLYKVLHSFKQGNFNTISKVIDDTKDDILFLDDVRLPEFISLLEYYGYLEGVNDDSFILTAKGEKKEEYLKIIVEEKCH